MPVNNPGSKQPSGKSVQDRDAADTLRFDQNDVRKAEQQGGKRSQNEGEGSRSADREYCRGVEHFVSQDDVEKRAEEAEEALDGEEADELAEAEEKGKRGPGSN
jgi:hypothetical protein